MMLMSRPGYTGSFPPSGSLDVKFTDALRTLAGTTLTPVVPCSEAPDKTFISYPRFEKNLIFATWMTQHVSLTPADCRTQPSCASAAAAAAEEEKKKNKSNTVLSGHWFDAERQQRAGREKNRKLIAER